MCHPTTFSAFSPSNPGSPKNKKSKTKRILSMNSKTIFWLLASVWITVASAQLQSLSPNSELGSIPTYDVAIVGAGLAGLTAARRFREQAPNMKIVILEARDRVGGRLWPVQMDGVNGENVTGDLGSLWISPKHTELLSLAKELNIEISKQMLCGERTVFITDDDYTVPGNLRDLLNGTSSLELAYLGRTSGFSVCRGYLAERNPPIHMKDTVNRFLQTSLDTPARNISMLQLMMTVNSEESSIEELLYNMGHGGSFMFKNEDSLSQKVEIHLNEAVAEIDIVSFDPNASSFDNVMISTVTGHNYIAKAVIVAVPPALVSNIEISPKMGANRTQLYKNYRPKGDAYYFTATFRDPSWRHDNKSGQLIFADSTGSGPILWATSFDTTPGDCLDDPPTDQLYGIAHFDNRDPPLTVEDRYAQYEDMLKRSFDNASYSIVDIRDHQWAGDELSQGAVGVLGCNMSEYLSGLSSEPHMGRIFFASAELSNKSMGMMNGAVISGQNAAEEVLSILKMSRDTPVLVKTQDMGDQFKAVTASSTSAPSLFTIVTAKNAISPIDSTSTQFAYQTSTVNPIPSGPTTPFTYHTSTPYPVGTFQKIEEMNQEREEFAQQWNDLQQKQASQQQFYEAPRIGGGVSPKTQIGSGVNPGIGGGAMPTGVDLLISELEQEVPFISSDDRLKTIVKLNNVIKTFWIRWLCKIRLGYNKQSFDTLRHHMKTSCAFTTAMKKCVLPFNSSHKLCAL
ncbi:hypothetical protein L596_010815 [Steinernema carpocapsae]|uniref:Amine oxidase n=1 Tax=Steinernema carpocapsae TaxID=34508 RepID=A0A4U5PJR9_STECR|nr:hypothetical protein L596_010815 [Steinernema carpocapsae]